MLINLVLLITLAANCLSGPVRVDDTPSQWNGTSDSLKIRPVKTPTCTAQLSKMQILSGIDGEQYRWRNGLYVHPKRGFNSEDMKIIIEGLRELGSHLCIPIYEWPQDSNPTGDYVEIVKGVTDSGCYSLVGRHGQKQSTLPAWTKVKGVMHETIHALGFLHEQSRPDRDDFVDIWWDNILSDHKGNFGRADGTLMFDVPYDYKSIMHYDSYAFSKSGYPTIVTKDRSVIPRNNELAGTDIEKLRRMYNCGGDSVLYMYEHSQHQGQRISLQSHGNCVNVPSWFNDRASSVDTKGTCMTVFEHGDCQGRQFDYKPGNGNHANLPDDGFNDSISSVRAC